ncbi:tlde1 domain-containing protein [Atlantibacter subterraneus]|uniref:tlde1 domain-containing protein n=1 Tax=Atlantibacter subterraneus TaxID=255519 RepID=UPI00142F001F|nr:tlde1 domain-containing protein [Atlantibacter subterranea]
MIYCYLNLRDVSAENNLKLICVGVGNFDVFTGLGELKNNANYYMEKNGPIPLGIYWIVDRPTGGFGSWLKKKKKNSGQEMFMMIGLRYLKMMVQLMIKQ